MSLGWSSRWTTLFQFLSNHYTFFPLKLYSLTQCSYCMIVSHTAHSDRKWVKLTNKMITAQNEIIMQNQIWSRCHLWPPLFNNEYNIKWIIFPRMSSCCPWSMVFIKKCCCLFIGHKKKIYFVLSLWFTYGFNLNIPLLTKE